MRCTLYLIGDAAYPIRTYLQKNWKICNVANVCKTKFDSSMNFDRVVIENAFASLKNRWQFLTHFNSRVDRATRVVGASCILYNYCKIWGQSVPHVGKFGINGRHGSVILAVCYLKLRNSSFIMLV